MNKNLEHMARTYLKNNLNRNVTEQERQTFCFAYGKEGEIISDVVDGLTPDQLDWCMTQVDNTIARRSAEPIKVTPNELPIAADLLEHGFYYLWADINGDLSVCWLNANKDGLVTHSAIGTMDWSFNDSLIGSLYGPIALDGFAPPEVI